MVKRSDVNERLPRFHEAVDAVRTLEKKGGLEGVPEYVTRYLDGAEPVGLDETGTVVLPEDYAPENGPPALMLLPHEKGQRNFGLSGSDAEVETARAIALQAGVRPASIDKKILDQRWDMNSKSDVAAAVAIRSLVTPVLRRSGRSSGRAYNFWVPRLLVVDSQEGATPDRLGEIMAHEADHWDFYLNEAGHLQRNPKRQLRGDEMAAIAEKRGYATSLKVRENLGHYTRFGHDNPLERFASIIQERRPRNPTDIVRLLSEYTKDPTEDIVALGVFAITTAFGERGKLLTKKELEVYKLLGVVKSD